jgi:hypothetical protein
MSKEEEIKKLAKILLKYGMEAQEAAMEAIVRVSESVPDDVGDEGKTIALAGAVALTQWKLDVVLAQILDKFPQYGVLIEGVKEATHDVMTKSFASWADGRARELGIK